MRVVLILSVASSVSAWSFTWTNSDGKSYVENDNSPVSCQTINHAEGETFRWAPGNDGYSLWLWENDNCSGSKAGYSPPSPWTKAASRDLRSFRVADEDAEDEHETTTTTATTTTTTSRPSTTTSKPSTVTVTQSTETTESTEEAEPTTTESTRSSESSDSSTESTQSMEPATSDEATETSTASAATSTSNTNSTPAPASSNDEPPSSEASDSDTSSTPVAAIAGGVVGGAAAIAAIGALFFFLGRRRRVARDDHQPPGYGGAFGPGDKSDTTTTKAPLSVPPTPMYGAAAYNPAWTEGKTELDSAPVYQVMEPEPPRTPVKQAYSPLDGAATVPHHPPATVVAELPGDMVMVEMSDAHRLNELDGSGKLGKW
ncbi:hypothetical protein BJX68DRAFT_27364 [Aspergillus pseudodeflectus]|uniref:Mid2 domain-containing protein n=1 Tax=Aspergillus pseudodeflectus TaxID=176178 RepID=A0ABR4JCS7_9EURO